MSSPEIKSESPALTPPPLEIGAIYTILFNRLYEGNWHWSICVATTPTKVTCINAIQPNTMDLSQWVLEIKELDLAMPQLVCVAVRIGIQDSDSEDLMPTVEEVLKPIPMGIPSIDKDVEPKFTCRVWWREAVRKLSSFGLIDCGDVDLLEKECKAFAGQNLPERGKDKCFLVHAASVSH